MMLSGVAKKCHLFILHEIITEDDMAVHDYGYFTPFGVFSLTLSLLLKRKGKEAKKKRHLAPDFLWEKHVL